MAQRNRIVCRSGFEAAGNAVMMLRTRLMSYFIGLAGLPALQRSEPGQVRKEAAIADVCKCRG